MELNSANLNQVLLHSSESSIRLGEDITDLRNRLFQQEIQIIEFSEDQFTKIWDLIDNICMSSGGQKRTSEGIVRYYKCRFSKCKNASKAEPRTSEPRSSVPLQQQLSAIIDKNMIN
jgi:hypothetical protein